MNYIDFHCDTIYEMLLRDENMTLSKNCLSVDINKLRKGNCLAQFFAIFVNKSQTDDVLLEALKMIDKFYNELYRCKNQIAIATCYDHIVKNKKENKISAFLTIEEGGVLKGNLFNLRNMHRLGVRLITLTWNYPNEIGFPSSNDKNNFNSLGLTSFGKELLEEMNSLNMLIDVSHLSDKGFYDVADISNAPFVASHSNARAVTNHPRNLTDDMIRLLATKGGVTGINFHNAFLGANERGTVDSIINHIKHLENVGGIDVISIGSDFDGISIPNEIEDAGQMVKLTDALSKNGFSPDKIEKIMYKNSLRVIKDVL